MQENFPRSGLDEWKWILAFATPDLEHVSLVPDATHSNARTPCAIASSLLKEIVSWSPNIRTLTLAAGDDEHSLATGDLLVHRVANILHSPEPWHHYLGQLQNLRCLTLSDLCLLPPCFEVIALLPNLTTLCIIPATCGSFDCALDISQATGLDPPNGAFPRLSHLSINGLEIDAISEILSIKIMLRRLTSIELQFWVDESGYSTSPPARQEEDYISLWALFRALEGTPDLREMSVSVHPSGDTDHPMRLVDQPDAMGIHSSLEHVYLGNMYFDISPDYNYVPHLTGVWPNLQTLSIPSQAASIPELESFANFPKLLELKVDLDLESPHLPATPRDTRAPIKILSSSGRVRLSDTHSKHHFGARALLSLWPSLQRVTWADKDPERMRLAQSFNEEISNLREMVNSFNVPQEDAELSDFEGLKVSRETI